MRRILILSFLLFGSLIATTITGGNPIAGTQVWSQTADTSQLFTDTPVEKVNDSGSSIDDQINDAVKPVTDFITNVIFVQFHFTVYDEDIGIPLVLIWLIGASIFTTIYFRFVNFRRFRTSVNVVRGKYTDPNEQGEVSHFQALTAALSGTVGLGNIAGVAIAISVGGPGATLWMIIAGLLGMSLKFTECTLGVKYRDVDKDGEVFGGPMYYLKKGFSEIHMRIGDKDHSFKKIGVVLAGIFSVACIGGSLGGGNMFQVNQAYKQFANIPEVQGTMLASNGWAFGLLIAVLVFIVIVGGVKSIARVTDKIVPFMVVVYVVAALIVIFGNISAVPEAFGLIFKGAFTKTAVAGGVIGVIIQGFRRAAFSNEAGIGSASIAHSAVRTNYAASEGLVSLLEPLIDTVVICTMTALVIVISGSYLQYSGDASTTAGVSLTSEAFGSVIWWFPYILSLAVLLFAFSTMLAWSYYGRQASNFLFGKSERVDLIYNIIFCLFIVLGAAASLQNVVDFSDAMIFAMCFPNVVGLVFLAPVVQSELHKYLVHINIIKPGPGEPLENRQV